VSFPKYEHYKDSGVEWLGEVPAHWRVAPIKHLGRLKGGAGFPHDAQGTQGAELHFHKVNALSKATYDGKLQPGEKNYLTRYGIATRCLCISRKNVGVRQSWGGITVGQNL